MARSLRRGEVRPFDSALLRELLGPRVLRHTLDEQGDGGPTPDAESLESHRRQIENLYNRTLSVSCLHSRTFLFVVVDLTRFLC